MRLLRLRYVLMATLLLTSAVFVGASVKETEAHNWAPYYSHWHVRGDPGGCSWPGPGSGVYPPSWASGSYQYCYYTSPYWCQALPDGRTGRVWFNVRWYKPGYVYIGQTSHYVTSSNGCYW